MKIPNEIRTFYVISNPWGYWHWTPEGQFIDTWSSVEDAAHFDTKADAAACIKKHWCKPWPKPKIKKVTISVTIE